MTVRPEVLFEALRERGIGLFVGVPDSLLKSFCAYVADHARADEHIIAANEGNAVGIAVGYHLATGRTGAVYLQNSGLGNTINPLTSLADREVYCVPLLLIIGWRGEPGKKDEPQHVKQGRISRDQLELLGIPCFILEAGSDVVAVVEGAFGSLASTGAPAALLVRDKTFSHYAPVRRPQQSRFLREEALREILQLTRRDDLVVSTTGKTSRELFELRRQRNESQRDFLTVGGMGHTSSIALGVALGAPNRRIVCLDGDGSMLMHMGSLPIIGDLKPKNLLHVVLNNGAHESVGGQPTVAGGIDIESIARASGYRDYAVAVDPATLRMAWERLAGGPGPAMLEVKIGVGSRDDLARPGRTPAENKRAFMEAARA